MLPANLTGTGYQGDAEAIAAALNQTLQHQGITVSADWHGDSLNLRFTSSNALNPERLAVFVRHHLKTLSIDVSNIRMFGYQPNQPKPLWHQILTLTTLTEPAASEQGSAAPLGSSSSALTSAPVDHFIVCGLGSLGQYSILNLKRFGLKSSEVHVTAIDQVVPTEWEIPDLPNLLENELIIGDCRDEQILLQAGIQTCRSILLVTSNDTINVEAAVTARRLNPEVRLIVRSSRQNLNQLLRQQLGNFAAFEPTELPATAFALAGLSAEILGYFKIGDCQLQIIQQQVQPRDFRFDQVSAASMYKKNYRLLSYRAAPSSLNQPTNAILNEHAFYQWQPDTRVQAGDTIAYIEIVGRSVQASESTASQQQQPLGKRIQDFIQTGAGERMGELGRWIRAQQNYQVISIGLVTALLLWILGTIILKNNVTGMTWVTAISKGFILLVGGYSSLFGGVSTEDIIDKIPAWVNFVCLGIGLISSLFILGVFGFIADSLLTSRFDFLRKRPPIPKQNHVVIVGFGRVGQRVATLLQQFKQPIVVLTEQIENAKLAAQVPLIVGDINTELSRVNLQTAKSIVLLTDDQMLNLEIALVAKNAAQQIDRTINLVIRTYNQRFSDNLRQLLPDAKAMAAYALSAEAFAGAAFGENILSLFRLNDRTILVTEYIITTDDKLVSKLLSEVAYGYGTVPIFYQKSSQLFQEDITEFLMPSDDVKLQVGDRLIILASLNGLRRIEYGEMFAPRQWRLEVQKPLNSAVLLDAGATLHRISGYNLDAARAFMNQLPGRLELALYDHQAYRLQQELNRSLPVTLQPI
jgi:voltage-gated potassium channel Kch